MEAWRQIPVPIKRPTWNFVPAVAKYSGTVLSPSRLQPSAEWERWTHECRGRLEPGCAPELLGGDCRWFGGGFAPCGQDLRRDLGRFQRKSQRDDSARCVRRDRILRQGCHRHGGSAGRTLLRVL